MRLTQIKLKTFKGTRETQVINLAPVTLLFGPNSRNSVGFILSPESELQSNRQTRMSLSNKTIKYF